MGARRTLPLGSLLRALVREGDLPFTTGLLYTAGGVISVLLLQHGLLPVPSLCPAPAIVPNPPSERRDTQGSANVCGGMFARGIRWSRAAETLNRSRTHACGGRLTSIGRAPRAGTPTHAAHPVPILALGSQPRRPAPCVPHHSSALLLRRRVGAAAMEAARPKSMQLALTAGSSRRGHNFHGAHGGAHARGRAAGGRARRAGAVRVYAEDKSTPNPALSKKALKRIKSGEVTEKDLRRVYVLHPCNPSWLDASPARRSEACTAVQ